MACDTPNCLDCYMPIFHRFNEVIDETLGIIVPGLVAMGRPRVSQTRLIRFKKVLHKTSYIKSDIILHLKEGNHQSYSLSHNKGYQDLVYIPLIRQIPIPIDMQDPPENQVLGPKRDSTKVFSVLSQQAVNRINLSIFAVVECGRPCSGLTSNIPYNRRIDSSLPMALLTTPTVFATVLCVSRGPQSSDNTSSHGFRCQAIYSQFGLAIHQNDHQARRRFVEWAQNEIAVVPDFHKRILFSDEAHFWLNGYVNKQNCRIWGEANSQVYVETPLHPEKLTVWCALWAGGILLQKR
ncbi:transposable element Tc3 transposase [Trichonephila clavipes]|uniref:Transposable element Tc3 transposase n=1 Tax=Trichonephila clavipes TaxID=2585209 RepID=A0A8X7BME4_TRICX|nr:transposable element Tc3 transposase [Trichonephila clavipes]